LSTVTRPCKVEIAFFGGSFTGIDCSLMIDLLERAEAFVKAGRVDEIRLSTRPDYIDDEILNILSRYSVRTVELGLQSMDDEVLAAVRRGHTADDARRACAAIKRYGFQLIGQMMIGLPQSDGAREVATAEMLCRMGVDGARVYPTVVFEDTELCRMAKMGEYIPPTLDDIVARTADVLTVLDAHDVPCIRVGLCASENLASDLVWGGANHSAVGELAMGEIFYRNMCRLLDGAGNVSGKVVTFFVPRGAVSRAVGQKKKNLLRIYEKYSPLHVKVLEKNQLLRYNIMIGSVEDNSGSCK